MTSNDFETLPVRPRETSDMALPSGNSVQLMNLVRLTCITNDAHFKEAANDLLRTSTSEDPSASTHLMSALDFFLGPSFEVVLAGTDVRALRRAVFDSFVPNKVVLHSDTGIARIAPFTKEQTALSGKATAYVCTNRLCKLPTSDPRKVRMLLDEPAR
jgi:uncharacterized protein YyaL (SSP411 family)